MSRSATLEPAPPTAMPRWRARLADVTVEAPRWLAVASVAAVALVHAAVAWGTIAPHIASDEIGMLANSLVISGGPAWELIGVGYAPGLAVLMAPLWWLTDDASAVFRAAIGLNVVISTVAVWPLSRIAARAGAAPRMAVVIAAVVSLAPARTLLANYVLAEALLVAVSAAAVVAAARLAERPTYGRAVVFGLLVGATFLVHGRSMMIALAAGVWCLTMLPRWRGVAMAAGAVSALATLTAYGAFVAVTSPLYGNTQRTGHTLDQLSSIDPMRAVASATGQAWYATFAWPALAIVGLAWLVWRWRQTVWVRFVLVGVVATWLLAVGTAHETTETIAPRMDLWVYGRYGDHLLAIVAVIGGAVLTRVRWPALSAAVAGVSAAVAGLFLIVTVPRLPVGGYYVDAHVAGIAPFLNVDRVYEREPEEWGLIAAVGVAFALAVLAAAWIKAAHLLILALLWSSTGLLHDASLDARDTYLNEGARAPTGFEPIPDDGPVVVLDSAALSANMLAYRLYPREVTVLTVEEATEYPIVFGPQAVPALADLGYKWYSPLRGPLSVLWVAPGPFYDQAEANGQLEEPNREVIDAMAEYIEARNASDTQSG